MPTYVYKCPSCGRKRDVVKSLALLDRFEFCTNACEGSMERQISAPRVIGDYAGYSCPVSGRWIEGRRAHEENLKRTGSRVLETGEHEANQRARKDQEAAFDREVDATVERFVDSLPSGKQEQLATEFSHGVDASVERRAYNPQE